MAGGMTIRPTIVTQTAAGRLPSQCIRPVDAQPPSLPLYGLSDYPYRYARNPNTPPQIYHREIGNKICREIVGHITTSLDESVALKT